MSYRCINPTCVSNERNLPAKIGIDIFRDEAVCEYCNAVQPDYDIDRPPEFADTQRTSVSGISQIRDKPQSKKDGSKRTRLGKINLQIQADQPLQVQKKYKVEKKIKEVATQMDLQVSTEEANNIAAEYIKKYPTAHVKKTEFVIAILFLLYENNKHVFGGKNLLLKLYEVYQNEDIERMQKQIQIFLQRLKKLFPRYNVHTLDDIETTVKTYVMELQDSVIDIGPDPENKKSFKFQKQVEDFVKDVLKKIKNKDITKSIKLLILVSIFMVAKQKNIKLNMDNYDKYWAEILQVTSELIQKYETKILEELEKQKTQQRPQGPQRQQPQRPQQEGCPSPPLTKKKQERLKMEGQIDEIINDAIAKQREGIEVEENLIPNNLTKYLTNNQRTELQNLHNLRYRPQQENPPDDWTGFFGMFPNQYQGGVSKRNKTHNKHKKYQTYETHNKYNKSKKRSHRRCSCKSHRCRN